MELQVDTWMRKLQVKSDSYRGCYAVYCDLLGGSCMTDQDATAF